MRSRRLLALLGSLLLVMPLSGCNAAGWIGVRLEGDVLQVAVPACVEQPTRIIVSLIHDDYDPDDDPDASTRRVERTVWRAEGPLTLPEAQGEYRVIPLDESLSPDTNGTYQGALEALDPPQKDVMLEVRVELDNAVAAAGFVSIESTTALRTASEGGLYSLGGHEGQRIEDLNLENTDLCPTRRW